MNSPFVAAPMAGVSSLPFRLTLKKGGAPLVYTEMVSCAGLIRSQPHTLRLARTVPEEGPLCMQLFGAVPKTMEQAAVIARKNFNPVLLDINMGCPVRKVRRLGAGSALLDTPALARQVLEAASQGFGGPVSVKIRLGYSRDNLDEILPYLLAARPAAITLHARTVTQGYGGQADWAAIGRLKRLCPQLIVIGNGDVRSAGQALAMMEQTGCDGVMIGRGALQDPYIFARAMALKDGTDFNEPSAQEIRGLLQNQADLALALEGEMMAVHLVRQFIMWQVRGKPGVSELRRQAGMSKSLPELLKLADNFFNREVVPCG